MPLATNAQWSDAGRLPWWRQPRQAMTNDYAKKVAKAETDTPMAFPRELMTYERKVNFAQIDNDLTALEAQSRERIHTILASAKEKVIALISRKVADGSLSTKMVNDLELRGIGQLVPTLREVLGAAFRQGERDLKGEIKRGMAQTARNASDEAKAVIAAHPDWDRDRVVAAVKSYQVRYDVAGLPPEKALEFFESKASLWGAEVRDPLLSDIKAVLYNAIKMGLPIREIQNQLEAAFLPWLGDQTQGVDDALLTPYRLETLIRTNSLEAYNAGRLAQGQPEVESGLITAYVFSAILDGRETAVCRFLDGKFFKPNSSELDRLSPPRRYSCRSIMVPHLRTEGPVVYITPDQVARGIALSGKGFCDHQHATEAA